MDAPDAGRKDRLRELSATDGLTLLDHRRILDESLDFFDLMHSAGQAHYKADEGGRNGVVAAG